ncbi:ArsR/SmtB family transcription factor [Neobacillus drentensis]|uniref:ArsR/SmtB family transcription factor n=1 Tax=Neobacillus drentensis TaxID=220684 RepID=UPI0030005531
MRLHFFFICFIVNHMVNYYKSNLDQVFSVLSDPTRRAIIKELSKGEKTVKKLAEPFDMSLPAFSKHMKVLESAGLVSYRKAGRYKYYYLHQEEFYDAARWLNDLKSFWESQLSSLERYLLNNDEEEGGNKK